MEDASVGEERSREGSATPPGGMGDCGIDPWTANCKYDTCGQCEVQQRSFSEARSPVAGVASKSHSCTMLYTSKMDIDGLNVRIPKNKKDCMLFHCTLQKSLSLDDLSNSGIGDHKEYAFSNPKIHGTCTDIACHKLQEALFLDASEICSVNTADQELCELNREDVNVSIVRQRSPSWVLLEHPDNNTKTSAFAADHTPQLVANTHKRSLDRLDVHSWQTDTLSLDHLSLHVGKSRGQEESVSDVRNEKERQCPKQGDSGGTCIDTIISDSCRESPTDNAPMLSSPHMDCAELTYAGDSSERSVINRSASSPDGAADSDTACAVAACPSGIVSPEDTSSTESLYDSLTDYDAVLFDKATDTDPASCTTVTPRCSTGVGHSSSGAVSRMEPPCPTETDPFVSPVTICQDTLHWVSVKRRPNSLQVTPMYVYKALPPAVDSRVRSDQETEDIQSQTPNSPVMRDAEVPQCDDHSSTSSNQSRNTSRYSWPASQTVQLRSRTCSRLRRKHVKSANMTSTTDLSCSTSAVGLSRRFHSQQLPLTKSASLGHGMFQNARWGCQMTSARLNDSRKSEKFIMALKKDGVLKPRTQQRCRHKRHSYHVTAGPCVTCTNHTNSLGPCFVLGIGQCNLCRDSGRNIDTKKNNDHPFVELEYVMPKSRDKTREAKTKVAERADSAIRNEMQQYTREKLGQRNKEDLLVLVEHFSRQARVVSEELVRLLQQKHDFIEQIEMRKVAIEQLLRLQMETK